MRRDVEVARMLVSEIGRGSMPSLDEMLMAPYQHLGDEARAEG